MQKCSFIFYYSLCISKYQSCEGCLECCHVFMNVMFIWLILLCFVCLFRTNTLKLEGVRRLWGKEGYLPKKENKVGKENEPQAVSCGSLLAGQMGDPPALRSDQVTNLSEEDKEKQQLASTLFIGLGSNAGVSLVSGSFET